MATWIQHFLLFSSLALCVLSARPVEDHAEQNLPTVQIINSLPPNSPPLNVSCSSKNIELGARSFSAGQVYEFKVQQKDTYSCAAQWQRYIESWNGFELPRDENHGAVYWLVKKDGFYRSWDKASWELENPWGTG
ncbi:S-protein [Salix suchowensis]|nr:S-protein [Salix suchowensis]